MAIKYVKDYYTAEDGTNPYRYQSDPGCDRRAQRR